MDDIQTENRRTFRDRARHWTSRLRGLPQRLPGGRRGQLIALSLLALLLVGGGTFWLVRRPHRTVAPAQVPGTSDLPEDVDIRFQTIIIRGVSNSKIVWQVEAERFDLLNNKPILRVIGLRKAVLLNGDKQELTLTGAGLEQNTFTKRLEFSGPVTVSGEKIWIRTGAITWDPQKEVLEIPNEFAAQIGDIGLSTGGGIYDVKEGVLRCNGKIRLGTGNNSLEAGSASVDTKEPSFTLYNPVHAEFDVADLDRWFSDGNTLPEIPAVPDSVKQRYQDYLRSRQANRPGRP